MTSSYRVHDIAEDMDFRSIRGTMPEKKPAAVSSRSIFVNANAMFLYSCGLSCNLVLIISNGWVTAVAIIPPNKPDAMLDPIVDPVSVLQIGFRFS